MIGLHNTIGPKLINSNLNHFSIKILLDLIFQNWPNFNFKPKLGPLIKYGGLFNSKLTH